MTSDNVFDDVSGLFDKIKRDLDHQEKPILIYAFNGTGKTRLANLFYDMNSQEEESPLACLSYSALFEDIFHWDNITNELQSCQRCVRTTSFFAF